MFKNDAIYNSLFRFRNIDLNNVNDVYFAINIIVIIATTLLETSIAPFILEFIIIIVINVNIFIIIVVVFEKPVFQAYRIRF